ncbi:hypothetical protein WE348_07500 [Alteromonas macleodii]|uniref:hypothetical protein n=1 Tax=Alteromonas macleodii TaxID=28108 RepID=UPI0030CAFB36
MSSFSNHVPTILVSALNDGRIEGGMLVHPNLVYPALWRRLTTQSIYVSIFWEKAQHLITNSVNVRFIHYNFAWKSFLETIELAFAGIDNYENKTPKERNEDLKEISQLAEKLSRRVRNVPFNNSADEMIDHESYYSSVACKVWGENWLNNLSHKENLRKLGIYFPSFEYILQELSNLAEREWKNHSSVVKKVNSDDAQITYFVRVLSTWCSENFSTPCHELVALATSITFDLDDFDKDQVRNKLKNYNARNIEPRNKEYERLMSEKYESIFSLYLD